MESEGKEEDKGFICWHQEKDIFYFSPFPLYDNIVRKGNMLEKGKICSKELPRKATEKFWTNISK